MSRGGGGDKPPRVTRADLEAKLTEINTELSDTGEAVKPKAIAVGVGALVLILILAFLLGRRKGERKTTILEVRRL
ncbi:MAG: hypothetical protein ABIS47_10890 [Acidimicrobiales bacterium]